MTTPSWTNAQYGRRLAAALMFPPWVGWILLWRNKRHPARARGARHLARVSTGVWLVGPLYEYLTGYQPSGAWPYPADAACFPVNSFARFACPTHIVGWGALYCTILLVAWAALYRKERVSHSLRVIAVPASTRSEDAV
jgi:hypothetical protein